MCHFTVAVKAHSALHYVVLAATDYFPIVLQNGVPQREHVATGEYEYFTVTVESDKPQSLSVIVTPISGDPDIYISDSVGRASARATLSYVLFCVAP
jgi:hypothetical protein